MATSIGFISFITGTASVQNTDGSHRSLQHGVPVYPDDVIQSDAESSLSILFLDGSVLDIGRNTTITLNTDVFNPNTALAEPEVDISALQQAILAGVDPTLAADPAAAGAGVEESEGSHEAVYVDYLAPSVIPESGFDTTGPAVQSPEIIVENAIISSTMADPVIPPVDNGGGTLPVDDDNGSPPDDPGNDNPPDDPGNGITPIDIDSQFPLAQSGQGYAAWLQNGNLAQFNALVSEHALGYGVGQTGNQPGRTDGLDNNESLLFKFIEPASQLTVLISANEGNQIGGTLIMYDADRVEIGQLAFTGSGQYLLIDEAHEISYLIVNGDSPDNHDGFYVSVTAQSGIDDFEDSAMLGSYSDDIVVEDDGNDTDADESDSILVAGMSTTMVADSHSDTVEWQELEDELNNNLNSQTITGFDPVAGDSVNLADLITVGAGDNISDYLNLQQVGEHLVLSVTPEVGGDVGHIITLENTTFTDLGLSNFDPVLDQSLLLEALIDNGSIVVDAD
ncbi:retention module-containing protein [Methylophaga sp.]|uniref:retention module-containing protein n=1 Tax=Methylophaga sp. TaxID=2024840 RepID=UPI0027187DB1|nr:retention module-containing protein [Methylophaga sp.]MDO8826109.1 retention module-containing protein [Methylophaga sp.]